MVWNTSRCVLPAGNGRSDSSNQIRQPWIRLCTATQQQDNIPDTLHGSGPAAGRQCVNGGVAGVPIADCYLDLDELVVIQGAVQFRQHIFIQALVSNGEHGFEPVAYGLEVSLFLAFGGGHAGSTRRVASGSTKLTLPVPPAGTLSEKSD